MIKLTEKKIEELIKEKAGLDTVFIGTFCDNRGQHEIPKRFAFLNKKDNKLIGLLESKLRKII